MVNNTKTLFDIVNIKFTKWPEESIFFVGICKNKRELSLSMLTLALTLFSLPDLGSNQDSSPPKGDVLPVTPSGNQYAFFVKRERKDKIFYSQNMQGAPI